MVLGGPELGCENWVSVADNQVGKVVVSGYKINKDLCNVGCINCYLHRLVVYHFCKPTDDDENQIVTGALPTMSRYWEELQVPIVFLGNEFSSLLDGKVSSS